jgi:uncharacterized membrane protein YdbT with pleckstrin-like domain
MDLHPGERIVFEGHPSWRSALGFHVGGFVAALAAGVLAGVLAGTTVGVVVVVAALALVLGIAFLQRAATHYVVTDQRLRIRRGLLSKHVQQTQIERVQNVNTAQSLLERLLRVGTVDFDTAGTEDSDFTFRGISDPAAVVAAVDRAQRVATADRL